MIAELERRGYRTAQARQRRTQRPASEPRRSKAAELDDAAKRGVMPTKPDVTSHANHHYQRRFDKLAELGAAGDWDAVAGYQCNGVNSYAKMVRQYRDRLVTAHNAQLAAPPNRAGSGAVNGVSLLASASIITALIGTPHAQYTAASPTWRAYCEAKQPISIGMTEKEVLVSRWGEPDRTNTVETAGHSRQQWVFEYGPMCTTRPGGQHYQPEFLYFADGILVTIQKSDMDDH